MFLQTWKTSLFYYVIFRRRIRDFWLKHIRWHKSRLLLTFLGFPPSLEKKSHLSICPSFAFVTSRSESGYKFGRRKLENLSCNCGSFRDLFLLFRMNLFCPIFVIFRAWKREEKIVQFKIYLELLQAQSFKKWLQIQPRNCFQKMPQGSQILIVHEHFFLSSKVKSLKKKLCLVDGRGVKEERAHPLLTSLGQSHKLFLSC